MTLALRVYVTNFANYNATYGAIGGVIVLLTWMYFSMLVFLIGGEINSELHQGHGGGGASTGHAVSAAGSRQRQRQACRRSIASSGWSR